MEKTRQKKGKDSTRTARSVAHLGRLAESGGKPVRVDTSGQDLALLDELVATGYASSRAEAYRKALRVEHARWKETENT